MIFDICRNVNEADTRDVFFTLIKGILRPIFCIDINTQCQEMRNYVKNFLKIYIFKMFSLLLIFFIDTIISVISSTEIACDVMCVQYVQKQPPEVFFEKGVLKNFANLRGLQLY